MFLVNRIRLAALAIALVASACRESPMQPVEAVDLPTALSEMSLSTIVPASLSQGISPPVTVLVPSRCAFASASQRFECTPITANGLTITGGFTLLGPDGQSLSAFDPTTVAAVRTTSSLTGAMTFGTDVLNIDQHETLTLSGLLSGSHVLNGLQVAHITGTFAGLPTDETVTSTIAGLVPPVRGSNNPYPGAGIITVQIEDAAIGGHPASSVVMTMTFNGTSKVTVTISSGGITQRCVVDLASSSGGGSCFG